MNGTHLEKKLDMSLDDLVASDRADRGTKRVYSSVEAQEAQGEVNDKKAVLVAKRIYVGNLSWHTSWQSLKDHFRQIGNVVYADVIRDPQDPSRSKGCGIVEFQKPEEALAAIQQLNSVELDGRTLFIREDREDRDLNGGNIPIRGARGNFRNNNISRNGQQGYNKRTKVNGIDNVNNTIGGARNDNNVTVGRRVYVANISYETTWKHLKDHFRQAGNVVYSDIMADASTGRSKGYGIVEFKSSEEALNAISKLSNSELHGRKLLVREDREDREAETMSGPLSTTLTHGQSSGATQNQNVTGFSRAHQAGGMASTANTQVVIQNLPWTITWQELKDTFRQCGSVVRADVILDNKGRSKGFGTVCFELPEDATAAIQMFNEQDFGGRIITVRPDKFA